MFHTWKGSGCGSPNPWAFILPSWTDRILWCSLRVFQIRYEELQPRKECDSNWCNKYSPQCHYSSCGWMSLRDALCTKPDLKGSQWLKYWWILMLSCYSKSKTSDKVMRCRAGKAYLHSLSASQTCSLRRELVCVFRGGTGQGARQSQALTKSSSTRFNLRAEWQGHFLLSPLPLRTAGATTSKAKLVLVPPGRAQRSRTFQHGVAQKWGWCCWQPKVPRHSDKNQEKWEGGRKIQQHILQRVQDISRTFMPCFSAHQTFNSCHWEPTGRGRAATVGTDRNLNLSLSLVLKHWQWASKAFSKAFKCFWTQKVPFLIKEVRKLAPSTCISALSSHNQCEPFSAF